MSMIKDFYKKFRIKDYMDNELKEKKIDYIDCSLGTNPFIEKRRVIEYIKKADFTPNEYVSNEYLLLKEALLDMYKTYVVDSVNKDNISFGSGTMGIIRNLSEFIIEKDSNVLGVSPQFTRFISEVELKQGKYDRLSLDPRISRGDCLLLVDNGRQYPFVVGCHDRDNAVSHQAQPPESHPCGCCTPDNQRHTFAMSRNYPKPQSYEPAPHRWWSLHQHRQRLRGSLQDRSYDQQHRLTHPCAHLYIYNHVPVHCPR